MKISTILLLTASLLHAQEPATPAPAAPDPVPAPAAPVTTPAAPATPVPAEPLKAGDLLDKMMPHLIKANGETVSINLKEKEHVLIYWSASWCGPCRKFTPKLIEFYNQNGGGDKFEIVLINLDKTEELMAKYMKSNNMPWPAVAFNQKQQTGAKSFFNGGIPRLMIINKAGEVLSRGNGPRTLNEFKKIIGQAP